MSKGKIKLSQKMFAVCVAPVLAVCTSRVNLECLLAIADTYRFLFEVLGRGPKMFMATNSSDLHDVNS